MLLILLFVIRIKCFPNKLLSCCIALAASSSTTHPFYLVWKWAVWKCCCICLQVLNFNPFLVVANMDSSSTCDENSESDFHPSPEDESESTNTETGCSTPTLDSLELSRTISNVSSFSEHSYGSHHRGRSKSKLVGRPSPVLNTLSMKQRGDILDRKPASVGMHKIMLFSK